MAPSSSRSQKSKSRTQPESTSGPPGENQLPTSLRHFNPPATPYISPYAPITTQSQELSTTIYSPQPSIPARSGVSSLLSESFPVDFQPQTEAMSTYSSSSQDSIYSSPGPRQYAVANPGMMSNPQNISAVSQTTKMHSFRFSPMQSHDLYICDAGARL